MGTALLVVGIILGSVAALAVLGLMLYVLLVLVFFDNDWF